VSVLDADGKVLSQSRSVDIGLALHRLVLGRVAVAQAEFDGTDVTMTLRTDGGVEIAFGPPGAPADVVVAPPPPDETINQRVTRILGALEGALKPVGVGGDLKAVSVRDARVVVVDQVDSSQWRADGARIDLTRAKKSLALAVEAEFRGPRGPAPAKLTIATDTAFRAATFTLATKGVRPAALLPARALGPAATLTTPVTANITLALDREKGVTFIEGDAKFDRGEWQALGGKIPLTGGRVKGAYDLASDKLSITELSADGANTKIKGVISVAQASALLGFNAAETARFDVSLSAFELEAPNVLAAPLALRDVKVKGVLAPKAPEIRFDKASFAISEARFDMGGRLFWGDNGLGQTRPGLVLDGAMAGAIDVRTVINAWPLNAGKSARAWCDTALKAGKISGAVFKVNLSPKDFNGKPLANNRLSLKGNFEDAEVWYLDEMTPIQDGRGRAEVQANRFDLVMDSGRVGNLSATNGKVEIPRLNPKGAVATFSSRAEGQTQEMIGLLLQAPLDLRERLPFNPSTITGRGYADWSIRRPLLNNVPAEQMKYTVNARMEGVGGQTRDGRVAISDWRLHITGDEKALAFAGPFKLGKSTADLNWTEVFRGDGPRSRYVVAGRFDATDIESLGIPILDYAQGPVGVEARVTGRGMDISTATLRLDLKEATMGLPFAMWKKPAGKPASAAFDARETSTGGLALTRMDVRGSGFAMAGEAVVDKARELVSATVSSFVIDGRTNLAGRASRGADGAMIIQANGGLFDVQPFLAGEDVAPVIPERPAKPVRPFQANVQADRVLMKADAVLSNARLDVLTLGSAILKLNVTGQSPGAKAFQLSLGGKGVNEVAPLSFKTEDAGFAFRAVTGQNNVRGGAAEGSGTWRPGAPGRAEITLKAKNFQVVQVPAMARLFSAVGSLRGMVEMLNGDGISFTGLESPLTIDGCKVYVAESRAAGPSIGITAKGAITMKDGRLDLDGVLVPSYGLNSFVSGVPVIGQILASRPGEGVFGMTYSINGPADAAKVGVNPLSALTPGILRRIFEPWAGPEQPPAADTGAAEKQG
jgi:hypothetical protein